MDEVETEREPTPPEATPRRGGPTATRRCTRRSRTSSTPSSGSTSVDLGLVYDVEVGAGGHVQIEYTLNDDGLSHRSAHRAADAGLPRIGPGVTSVDVEMVLRPPWSPEMMSEEAKAALGYF